MSDTRRLSDVITRFPPINIIITTPYPPHVQLHADADGREAVDVSFVSFEWHSMPPEEDYPAGWRWVSLTLDNDAGDPEYRDAMRKCIAEAQGGIAPSVMRLALELLRDAPTAIGIALYDPACCAVYRAAIDAATGKAHFKPLSQPLHAIHHSTGVAQ